MGGSGRCLSRTSDALGCVCWGPPGWQNRKLPDRTSVVVGQRIPVPPSVAIPSPSSPLWVYLTWQQCICAPNPTLPQADSGLFSCLPAAKVCWLILPCMTVVYLFVAGSQGDCSCGPPVKIRGLPGPEGERGILGTSGAPGAPGPRGDTGSPGQTGQRGEQVCSSGRTLTRAGPASWGELLNDLLTGLQGFSGFPGVKGLKGQKGDFTLIDIKGEFFYELF